MNNILSNNEMAETSSRQLYGFDQLVQKKIITLDDFGDRFPGNILVTNLETLNVEYINKRGSEGLKHSTEEIVEKGALYFKQFFYPEDVENFVPGYFKLYKKQDSFSSFSFAHHVLIPGEKFPNWYFAIAKLYFEDRDSPSHKVLLLVNKLNEADRITKKIASVLEESDHLKKNFPKFSKLSKREKEIITLLVNGKSTAEISNNLFISKHTVNTHRKNISTKLDVKNNSELFKFAMTFNLFES